MAEYGPLLPPLVIWLKTLADVSACVMGVLPVGASKPLLVTVTGE
jgi:hypothetical protein